VPAGTVGLFEGAHYTTGAYRPIQLQDAVAWRAIVGCVATFESNTPIARHPHFALESRSQGTSQLQEPGRSVAGRR
jgi:hypothetical protein